MKTEYEGKSAEELAELLETRDGELEQAEADKNATVGELKELRTKKQDLEQALEEANKKPTETEENQEDEKDTKSIVEQTLNERAAQEAKQNRESAMEAFRASQHEFSEAADPGGIKFAAFEKELEKFNFDGLSSTDDFTSRFKEVHQFMNRGQEPADDKNRVPHRGTNQHTGGEPPAGGEHELDAREKKLMEQTGWTKERLLSLKEKQPAFYEQQLGLVQ